MKSVKEAVPGFQEKSAFEKCCPNLTFKQVSKRVGRFEHPDFKRLIPFRDVSQRIIGFASCAGFGYLLSMIVSCMHYLDVRSKTDSFFMAIFKRGR